MAGIRARALSTKGFLNTQVMVSGSWGAEGRSGNGPHHTQRWGRTLPVAAPIFRIHREGVHVTLHLTDMDHRDGDGDGPFHPSVLCCPCSPCNEPLRSSTPHLL